MGSVMAMIMAGGAGNRLSVLSERRAKPAVPFGGIYRLIDFTMSNVMRSGIPCVGILTQYKPYSLMDHIGMGESWGFIGRNRTAKVLPPYVGEEDSDWYAGTADAVYQNLSFIDRIGAETILILSGDHVYNMDYLEMVRFHEERGADLTIAAQEVAWEDTSRFGILESDANGLIVRFQEKPKQNPCSNMANLGIYVFRRSKLEERLREDAANSHSNHDFGKDIIPRMLGRDRSFSYPFEGYWRDVGTVRAYWEGNLESLDSSSGLDLHRWQVRTNTANRLAKHCVSARFEAGADVRDSLVAAGCFIEGEVVRSVLSPGVRVGKGARVEESVLLHDTIVQDGAILRGVIADKEVSVGRGAKIGCSGDRPNDTLPGLLNSGLTLIGKFARIPEGIEIGRNCLIFPKTLPEDFPSTESLCGSTVSSHHSSSG